MSETLYTLDDLLYLMQRLRTPDTGCPWDLAQSYQSITPSTIEEAYEVVDAIDRGDYGQLKEELGDYIFQAVFYARLAEEEQRFNFGDIVHTLTDKLIRRHPHVFPDGTLQSVVTTLLDDAANVDGEVNTDAKAAENVRVKWETIKEQEREQKGQKKLLDDVPLALPALQRAQKLQKRVAKAGMDWRSTEAVFTKLEEEIGELREAINTKDQGRVKDELGDVLFTCVNLARHVKQDADQSLRHANSKFTQRIDAMSRLLMQDEQEWRALNDEQLDTYWCRAKKAL